MINKFQPPNKLNFFLFQEFSLKESQFQFTEEIHKERKRQSRKAVSQNDIRGHFEIWQARVAWCVASHGN
jgi:hypothetical protein